MRPILFIDRDGTIISETADEQIDAIEKLNFLPEVLYYLRKIKEEMNYLFVMVTNQDGLGTPAFPDDTFWPVQHFLMRLMKSEQVHFDAVHIDAHYASDHHPNRKPGTGMLTGYMRGGYDLKNSFVIGDRSTDVELAENLGCKAIYLTSVYSTEVTDVALRAENWEEIYAFLSSE